MANLRNIPAVPERIRKYARQMRKEPTDAEKKLWSLLRDRQLAGFKFRRQHAVCGYIIDFYCAAGRLGIELDGGQHLDPAEADYDAMRTEMLEGVGEIRIVRFPSDEVLKHPEEVSAAILEILVSPLPNPLPVGEGARDADEEANENSMGEDFPGDLRL